jgi:hypothetical protein
MSRRWTLVALALIALLAIGAPAAAAKKTKFRAKPWTFDPGGTGIVSSAWVTHQGLGDAGKSDHALVLKKLGTTATVASAGASISKVKNRTLTELGFDYEVGTHCGAGAPRFNVITADGKLFFFGCSHGTVTGTLTDSQGDTWNRVRFDNTDAFPQDGVSAWPGFGAVVVSSVSLVFDEGSDTLGVVGAGVSRLDNIDVNGKLIGKPGNSRN